MAPLVSKGFLYMLISFCNPRGVLGSKVSEMNSIPISASEKAARSIQEAIPQDEVRKYSSTFYLSAL